MTNMADTGEDREIKPRADAHEAEAVRESKELVRKTKENLSSRKNASKTGSGHRMARTSRRRCS